MVGLVEEEGGGGGRGKKSKLVRGSYVHCTNQTFIKRKESSTVIKKIKMPLHPHHMGRGGRGRWGNNDYHSG